MNRCSFNSIKYFVRLLIIWFFTVSSVQFVFAGSLSVVVHPDVKVEEMTKNEVRDIFLGRVRSLPNGEDIEPVFLSKNENYYKQFAKLVLNRSLVQLKAIWSRLIFTGEATPPEKVDSSVGVRDLIMDDMLYIGFMLSEDVDASVKVVYSVDF